MTLPYYIRIKVREHEKRGINLYIPMLFIYLILLPLAVLIVAVWLLVSLVTAGTEKGKIIFSLIPAVYLFVCSARGTEIDIRKKESKVILRIM